MSEEKPYMFSDRPEDQDFSHRVVSENEWTAQMVGKHFIRRDQILYANYHQPDNLNMAEFESSDSY